MNTAKPTEPTTHPHRQTPLDFTALWMRVVVAGLVIVAAVWVLTWRLPAALVDGRNTVAGVVIVVAGLYAGTLAVYARLQHFTAYGRTERAVKPDPGGIVYLTQRLTVAGEPVDRDATPVSFGVDPSMLKRALAYVNGGGETSRAKMTKALGLSQKQWQSVMAGLEDMGAVTNNGRAGIAADLAEVGRLLDELDAQGW